MTVLWRHQELARKFSADREGSVNSGAMGSGKSAVATTLNDDFDSKRTLILAPKSCLPVWRRELARHARRELDVCILDEGTVAQRTDRAEQVCAKTGNNAVIVVNYEAAAISPVMRSFLLSQTWDFTIADEGHRIQFESKTSIFAKELREKSRRRLVTTGTCFTQSPINCFGAVRFASQRVFGDDEELFRNLFENRYSLAIKKDIAKIRAAGRDYHVDPRFLTGLLHEKEFFERLATVAYRVESSVLDLPPLTIEQRTFKLSPSARRLYNCIQNDWEDPIASGLWPVLRTSFTICQRLQEITSGWQKDVNGEIQTVDTGKQDCLRDILQEAGGESVVVFCRYRADLDIVKRTSEELGLRYGEISGRSKSGLSSMGTMADGYNVIGLQEQAGAAGIDLTAARLAVDYSPSWSLSAWDQKVARLHRPPQTKGVFLVQLVAEDSIDQEIYLALNSRREIVKEALLGLRNQTAKFMPS